MVAVGEKPGVKADEPQKSLEPLLKIQGLLLCSFCFFSCVQYDRSSVYDRPDLWKRAVAMAKGAVASFPPRGESCTECTGLPYRRWVSERGCKNPYK